MTFSTVLPSALPNPIRCAAGCGATWATISGFASTDDDTVEWMRRAGWQVVNGDWTCPNDLPDDRRDLPGAMGRRPNLHCGACGDTRGGAYGHETSECTWTEAAA